MNDERAISAGTVVAGVLWAWVALLVTAAWGAWAVDDADLASMLGITACASSAAAATAHIRCYATRLCAVIRASGRQDADVYALPPRR